MNRIKNYIDDPALPKPDEGSTLCDACFSPFFTLREDATIECANCYAVYPIRLDLRTEEEVASEEYDEICLVWGVHEDCLHYLSPGDVEVQDIVLFHATNMKDAKWFCETFVEGVARRPTYWLN